MRINREYMDVMRRGKWVLNKATFRKQHESAYIVFGSIVMSIGVILIAILAGAR